MSSKQQEYVSLATLISERSSCLCINSTALCANEFRSCVLWVSEVPKPEQLAQAKADLWMNFPNVKYSCSLTKYCYMCSFHGKTCSPFCI